MASDNNLAHARAYRGRQTPLVEESLEILEGRAVAPFPRDIKHKQLCAVETHDDYALALWSRIRFQWLAVSGRLEVSNGH